MVEDNVSAADSLAELLEMMGNEVRVARDGTSGLALARELLPDLVLCDIGLPDLDGYEVARVFRGDPLLRAVRLVALTGYTQPDEIERAREAGFDAHLGKPTDVRQLVKLFEDDGEASAVDRRARRSSHDAARGGDRGDPNTPAPCRRSSTGGCKRTSAPRSV